MEFALVTWESVMGNPGFHNIVPTRMHGKQGAELAPEGLPTPWCASPQQQRPCS